MARTKGRHSHISDNPRTKRDESYRHLAYNSLDYMS